MNESPPFKLDMLHQLGTSATDLLDAGEWETWATT